MAYFSTHSAPEQDHIPQFAEEDQFQQPLPDDSGEVPDQDIFSVKHPSAHLNESEEYERRLDRLRMSAGFLNWLLILIGILLIVLVVFILTQMLSFVRHDLTETFPLLQNAFQPR